MNRNSSPFKWRHYAPDVILLCVRWYCRYSLSYRDVEEMASLFGVTASESILLSLFLPQCNSCKTNQKGISGVKTSVAVRPFSE